MENDQNYIKSETNSIWPKDAFLASNYDATTNYDDI